MLVYQRIIVGVCCISRVRSVDKLRNITAIAPLIRGLKLVALLG